MRIGLFGGTFDPPHLGHVQVATTLADQLDLDRVFFVVCGDPYHKHDTRPDLSPASIRAALVAATLADTKDERFAVELVELTRSGPTYSVDTARWAAAHFPDAERYWLVGHDTAPLIDTWHDVEHFRQLVEVAVFDEVLLGAAMPGSCPQRSTPIREALANGERSLAEAWLTPTTANLVEALDLYLVPVS